MSIPCTAVIPWSLSPSSFTVNSRSNSKKSCAPSHCRGAASSQLKASARNRGRGAVSSVELGRYQPLVAVRHAVQHVVPREPWRYQPPYSLHRPHRMCHRIRWLSSRRPAYLLNTRGPGPHGQARGPGRARRTRSAPPPAHPGRGQGGRRANAAPYRRCVRPSLLEGGYT